MIDGIEVYHVLQLMSSPCGQYTTASGQYAAVFLSALEVQAGEEGTGWRTGKGKGGAGRRHRLVSASYH